MCKRGATRNAQIPIRENHPFKMGAALSEVDLDSLNHLVGTVRFYGTLEQEVHARTDQRAGVIAALSGVVATLTAMSVLADVDPSSGVVWHCLTFATGVASIALAFLAALYALRVVRNRNIDALDAVAVVDAQHSKEVKEVTYNLLEAEVQHYAIQRQVVREKGGLLRKAADFAWGSVVLAVTSVVLVNML